MRTPLRFVPILLALLPASAHAMTMEYLTYNAFDETVAAFKRLALIVSDSGFIVLAGCFVAVSCVGATLMFGAQALGRGGSGTQHPASLIVPFLIGTVIFWGAVIPKGTLQIYDPVRNKTEAVPDVPALIALLAGGLSTVEKGMTTMVDTASANPYKDDAGGISYSLIFGAVKASTPLYNLDRSLSQYFKDCGMTAIGSGYNGASMQEVIKGAAGSDLYAAFSKWNHPAWGTVWFPEGNDAGVTGSCAESWAYLSSKLNGEITTTMNPMKRAACESAGFNWSDGAQVDACDAILREAAAKFDSPTATSEVLLRAITMGKAIALALNDPDFNVGINTLVNRQMMSEAFGASASMNEWVPRLRGIMIAVAVGVTPICLLFIATPLVLRALAVVAGLFIWLALWGICDVIAVQMQADAAFDAFTEVKRHFLGYEAIMNAPEGAVAALGVFGKARTMAMVLATVLSGGLFKLASSYAFTSMGQSWQGDFNQGGEAAGKQRLQVEQQAALQDQLVNAPGTIGRQAQFGYDTNMGAANYGAQRQVAQYDYLAGVTSGHTGDLAYRAGELSGGQEVGNVLGGQEYAGKMGMPLGSAASAVTAAGSVDSAGRTMGARERAESHYQDGLFGAAQMEGSDRIVRDEQRTDFAKNFQGDNLGDQLRKVTDQEQSSTVGMGRASGFDPKKPTDLYEAGHRESFGRLAAYRDELGVDPSDVGRASGIDAGVHSRAVENVEKNRGAAAMTAGEQYRMTQGAVAGTTAQHLGGVDSVAGRVARVNTVGEVARADMRQKVADYFAPGSGMAGLYETESRAAGLWQGSAEGATAERMIGTAQTRGDIDASQAATLRRQVEQKGSIGLAATFDPATGQPLTWSMSGIVSGDFGSTVDTRYRNLDSTAAGFDYSSIEAAHGGAALLGQDQVRTLMGRAFNLDGSTNPAAFANFGNAYADAFTAKTGHRIESQTAEDFRKTLSGGVYAGAEGRLGFGLPKWLPGEASATVSAGLRASADVAKAFSDQTTIGTNETMLLMQGLGAGALDQAKGEYIKDHGALPAVGSANYDAVTEGIYNRASEIFRQNVDSMGSTTRDETHSAREQNDVLDAAEKLLDREKGAEQSQPAPVAPSELFTMRNSNLK